METQNCHISTISNKRWLAGTGLPPSHVPVVLDGPGTPVPMGTPAWKFPSQSQWTKKYKTCPIGMLVLALSIDILSISMLALACQL